jgi:hypothetical protein
MLQRIQTIYLALFIVLSVVMLTGVSILHYEGTGVHIKEAIELEISSLNISGSGELSLPNENLEQFSSEMKALSFDFNPETQKLYYQASSPFLIVQILLTLFAIMTLFGYKNLKRQINLARATFFLTLLYVVGVMLTVYFALDYANPYMDKIPLDNLSVTRKTDLGFYLICSMLPFAYLAQLGIKRDLDLIKSLDRLR